MDKIQTKIEYLMQEKLKEHEINIELIFKQIKKD